MADLNDLECPACGHEIATLSCGGCGASYDVVMGVPFIGNYEADDALGLIEIAATIATKDTQYFTAESVAEIEALCAGYAAASDKVAFQSTHPTTTEYWFPNRYQEFLDTNRRLKGIDLNGKRVLDVGAGLGFDSQRLSLRGADVTALEFNPNVASNMAKYFPHMRCVGGFSHAVPFKSGTFDAVFFNASLHHMRDIPAAIAEALRVLRPGGTLITSSDPFRADEATQHLELEVFDKHTSVLLGINEQIPRFGDFVTTLRKYATCVDVELFTHMLYGGRSGTGPDLKEWTRWNLEDDGWWLAKRAGSIAMRVRLLSPLPRNRALQTAGVLKPAEYVSWMKDEATAVSRLAALIPSEFVDRPFPGEHSKFDLLNGWRLPLASRPDVRTAYQRARWFLTRGRASTLTFRMRSPIATDFEFRINGVLMCNSNIGAEWVQISLPLSSLQPNQRFVAEIKRVEKSADFDASCFDVGDRRLITSARSEVLSIPPSRQAASAEYSTMSQMNSIIAPEIRDDALYELIKRLAETEQLTSVLEIGSSAGGGSTEAFVAGLSQNSGNPKLFCVEVSKVRFDQLRATYSGHPFVHCYNRSSVSVDEFPKPEAVREFYEKIDTALNKYPLGQVLGWLDQDIAYVRDAGVEAGAIETIKAEHGIHTFDMVLIDGSEFTGVVEYEKVRGARLILLDDTNTFKCWHVRQELLADPMYDLIADDQELRNGYSAFRRRKLPRRPPGNLPIQIKGGFGGRSNP